MIGSIVLTIALACSISAMVMFFLNFRGYKNTLNYGRLFYHLMAIFVIIAASLLWFSIIRHDYSIKYVYSYSSNDLPLGFLLATFWGGQEGSFMLWLLLSSIVGIVLQSYSSKRGDLEPRVMAVFTLVTTFLLVMVSPLFKNPFAYIWAEPIFISAANINHLFFSQPWLQSFLFKDPSSGQSFVKMNADLYTTLSSAGISVNQLIVDGKGLNPQLLNFWMQIHPPILFTGFSMASVPFCFAMAALMKNDYRDWVRQSFPWILAAAGILGLGIMLGGYWAYEMLGWGGYWAWDPVENSSLIPWLVAVASIHTLLVQRKSQAKGGVGKYAKTNLILCIMTYVLVLYSTFLTRSGVLGDASVHSFVDPGMIVFVFLLLFIFTFLDLATLLFFIRFTKYGLKIKKKESFIIESLIISYLIFLPSLLIIFFLTAGNVIIAGIIGVYKIGFLIYAIVEKQNSYQENDKEGLLSRDLALFTAAIALCCSAVIVLVGTSAPIFGHAVDTFFYNEMHIPLVIIIGLLNGLSLLLKWKQTKGSDIFKKSLFPVTAALVLTALIVVIGKVTDIMMILLALSAAFAFFVNLEIAIKIVQGNLKMLGAYVAHIGIALFILGVIGSTAYSKEVDIDLIKNEPKEAFGYKMTFTGWNEIDNNTKYAFNIDLKKGDKEFNVKPVMYISKFNNGLMREPSILTSFTKDFYVSPLGYDDGTAEKDSAKNISLNVGEKTNLDGMEIEYKSFSKPDVSVMRSGGDFQMGTNLQVTKYGKTYNAEPILKREGGSFNYIAANVDELNLKILIKKIDPKSQNADFVLSEIKSENKTAEKPQEVLSISASVKPFINLVWVGVLIMVFGFFISVAKRLKESLVK